MEHGNAPAAGQIKSLVRLDEQYRRALAIAIEAGRASVSMIQRKLNIRYSEAQDLVVRMLRDGLVSIEDTPGVPTEIARATLPAAAACAEQGEAQYFDTALVWLGQVRDDFRQIAESADKLLTKHCVAISSASLPPPAQMSDEQIDAILDAAHRKAVADGITNGGMVGQLWNHIAARAILSASCAPKQTEGDGK